MNRVRASLAVVALIALGILAVSVIGRLEPSQSSTMDIAALEPEALELPSEYQRFDEATQTFKTVALSWSLNASGESTESTCGSEAMWLWSQTPNEGSSQVGDPTVRLFVCTAASPVDAANFLSATPIEDTVVPRLDGIFEANSISIGDLGLQADDAAVACVWGMPDDCRAWAYAARYDRYVVNASFVLAGAGGGIDEEAFKRLVKSIDEFLRQSLPSVG